MASYKTTDIYLYLKATENYLKGDLREIKKLCKRAEKREAKLGIIKGLTVSGYAFPSSITTQTTSSSLYSNTIHRITIPISLSLFATIDYIGYIVGTNSNPLATGKNFGEFFIYANKLGFSVTSDQSDLLNTVFRQGLTHVYFPKLSVGISYHSTNPSGKLFYKEINGTLVLNINELEAIVMSTLKKILKDSKLYPTMEAKYQSLVADYKTKHASAISSIKI